jgi:hypothetical protein
MKKIVINTGGGDAPGLNAVKGTKFVPLDCDTIAAARDLGISFGD